MLLRSRHFHLRLSTTCTPASFTIKRHYFDRTGTTLLVYGAVPVFLIATAPGLFSACRRQPLACLRAQAPSRARLGFPVKDTRFPDHSSVSGNDRLASKLLAPRCPGDGRDQRVFPVAACFSATVRSLIALQTLRAVDGAGSPCPIADARGGRWASPMLN